MADYDFSTLGSSDLEKLVCDLLNEALPENSPIRYKTFRDGKDKGIDFLYSTTSIPYNHVGQVKHYYRTGYSGLESHLTGTEVAKVERLKPKKYIFATSVDLSVAQTAKIKQIFSPYLKNINDIYGKADLNQLLQAHPNVLATHFKLWFSDTTVMQKILQSGMYYRTADFIADELTRRLRIYVETPTFENAKNALEKNRFVVITGEPGVGKSTLAETLVYQYLQQDYELLHINYDINEAEAFLRPDDTKQIIYFDDFLGSTKAEMNKAQGSEAALLSIVRRVSQRENKRLVFTTRVHVLNSALDDSEKLTRSKFKMGQTIFNLEEYDIGLKEKLFQNHIDEAEISEELKEVLREPSMVEFIIKHKNFNPRSIEFITSRDNVSDMNSENYRKFIEKNYDSPVKIWGHAYRKQIDDYERILLNTLLTFDGPISVKVLEDAYNKRIGLYPAQSEMPMSPFRTAISRLENGLIHIKHGKVDFYNTSLKDFIDSFLINDPNELKKMMGSIRYVNQLSDQFLSVSGLHNINITDEQALEMKSSPEDFVRPESRDHDLIYLATYLQRNVSHAQQSIIKIINMVYDWESLYKDYSLSRQFKNFLEEVRDDYSIQQALNERKTEIVDDLILSERDVFSAVNLLEQMQSTFDIDFEDYDTKAIKNHLEQLFDEHVDNEIDWLFDFITDEGEASEKQIEILKLINTLGSLGIDISVDLNEFIRDWHEIAMDNYFREQMAKDN